MTKAVLRIRVTEKDIGWSKFLRVSQQFKGKRTEIGLPEKGTFKHNPESKVTSYRQLMLVAMFNEFGSTKIKLPERALFRISHDKNKNHFSRMMNSGAKDVFLGRNTVDNVLFNVGEFGVQKIRDTLINGVPPPNAASTIKRKGFDHPLLMTGQLYDNIQHREYTTNARS